MIVAVVGGGALGTLVGAALARTCDVRVLVRDASTARAIAAGGGLTIEGSAPRPVLASHDPECVHDATLLVVAVKAYATAEALAPLRSRVAATTPVLSLQNGIAAADDVATALARRTRIALGPTTEAATTLAPGVVRRAGAGHTHVGWAAGSRREPPPEELAALLRRCGLAATAVDAVEPYAWGKLVVNAAINPVTALARVTNGELLTRADLHARAARLAVEAALVAAAEGIALPFADPVAEFERVARITAANRSSMSRDLAAGRPTEIDAISGAIVRRAAARGIAVPATQRVLDEVRGLAKA